MSDRQVLTTFNRNAAGSAAMSTFDAVMEKHHRPIIFSLAAVIAFFAVSCTFHDIIPVCHYLFGCDHAMHLAS